MALGSNVLQIVINGVNRTGGAFSEVAAGAVKMGAAVGAALTAAAYRAGQFEKGLAEISTLLDGDVSSSMEHMRSELLDLSVEFGQTIGKLTKARYDIISAGFTDAADSAAVLTAANKLAIAGVSDVASTADLLTTAINGLGLSARDADSIADKLFQTVRKGKTTVDQLAAAFGPVFATARVAKIGMDELGAAMATLTANGIDTRESATALNNLLKALAAPSGDAKAALDDLGINLKRGLLDALIRLGEVGDGDLEVLARLVPNIRALKAAASAAADIGKLNANLVAMQESAGQVDKGVAAMAETFDFKVKQMRSALDALVIEVGTAVLPAFTNIVNAVRDAAVIVAFLGSKTEDGVPQWKIYGKTIIEDVQPAIDALQKSLGWVRDRITEVDQALRRAKFNDRVTAKMKEMLEAGGPKMSQFQKRDIMGNQIWDFTKLRAAAEEIVRLEDAAAGRTLENEKTIFTQIADFAKDMAADVAAAIAQVRADIQAAKNALVPASEIIQSGFGVGSDKGPIGPDRPNGGADSDRVKKLKEDLAEIRAMSSEATPEVKALLKAIDLEKVRQQVASLAEFTAEDFAQMAFNIGDGFANVATDVASTMLGLRDGPLMLGRAFAQMAVGILNDIARIIARLLVAKALMSIFGGGGIFGKVAGVLSGNAHGGYTNRAASGFTVPVGMPSMILPGSPGLDRTLVAARGGELFVPRERLNAAEMMMRRTMTAPRVTRGSRGSTAFVNVQASRPFRRSEQLELRDSVVDGLYKSERHRA